jgi:hypothetical protein
MPFRSTFSGSIGSSSGFLDLSCGGRDGGGKQNIRNVRLVPQLL